MTDLAQPSSPTAFSASDAALEGFRVIRAQWRLIVGWAVFELVALVLVVVVSVIVLLMLAATGGSTMLVGAASLLSGLGAFVIQVMIVTALYRTLLRFEEPGFLHLRLGADEARMLGVWLATGFGALLWIAVATSFVAWVQRATNTPLAFLAGVVCLGGLIYLWTRLCLTAPMTFDTHHFQFAGSWRMTRGRVLPLMGMTLIAFCLLAMMAVVGWFVLYLAVGAISGFHDMGLPSLEDKDVIRSHPIAWLVQSVGETIYFPLFWALVAAPEVAAYKYYREPAA